MFTIVHRMPLWSKRLASTSGEWRKDNGIHSYGMYMCIYVYICVYMCVLYMRIYVYPYLYLYLYLYVHINNNNNIYIYMITYIIFTRTYIFLQ